MIVWRNIRKTCTHCLSASQNERRNDPASGKLYGEQLGFTCAACHTGHIEYKNVAFALTADPPWSISENLNEPSAWRSAIRLDSVSFWALCRRGREAEQGSGR